MTDKGFCQCGCGGKTTIAKQTYTHLGHVKGEPVPFILNHHFRLMKQHPRWKGDAVGNKAAHLWLLKVAPKQGRCEHCGREAKTHHAFKGENGEWSRNRDDYLELCPSCHKRFDLGKVREAANEDGS